MVMTARWKQLGFVGGSRRRFPLVAAVVVIAGPEELRGKKAGVSGGHLTGWLSPAY
jgi:hypothetical protein